jgi:hypothetical protein
MYVYISIQVVKLSRDTNVRAAKDSDDSNPKSYGSRQKWLTNIPKTKTYNRRDSQMVTHSSTSRPVQCLCMAERTGCPVLTDLWSYVEIVSVD